jgi:hypothetical protein
MDAPGSNSRAESPFPNPPRIEPLVNERSREAPLRVHSSWEGFAGQPPLEGRPIALDWEAPETFETHTSWIDDAIDRAAKLLAGEVGRCSPRR